ncbi:MAG: B12-binding domain-containing radical SAM protein [Candidatus Taylorbacteria bacterium RIFCSPLOWO2_02_FULL_45_10b]|nr:MAG: B12-binding domain-containing radical SAM protein [Candidatus Taylorbacteria bacterium RIFCSPLOWO2_02_FULL_45_10b]
MTRVLLINPVVREEDDPRHIPYGISQLAALADQAGHLVQILDANAWRPDDNDLKAVLQADDWDVIGVGGITTTYGYTKKIMRYAKQYSPHSLRVLGGGILTSIPQDMMRLIPEVDLGVVGEGFVTFSEILEKIAVGDLDFSKTLGVIYRDQAGNGKLTPPRPLIPDLDVLPYPAWDMLPMDIYLRNSSLIYSEEAFSAKKRMDVNGSFGCPFICRFCFHLGLAGDLQYQDPNNPAADVVFTYNRENRVHSPKYIVQMVKHMRDKYGADFVIFFDENLLAMNAATHNTWLPEVCRLWIEAGLQPQCVRDGVPHDPEHCHGVHWGGTSHAAHANSEILRLMHGAGCSQLVYGYESFSKRVLKNVGKGSTPETNKRSLHLTMEAGIRPIPNQIMGFPDDWFDSLIDCVEAWEELGIEVKPFFATPYPGSEWFNKYKDRILAQYGESENPLDAFLMDLGDATKVTAVICENFNAVELLGLRELMVARDIKRIREYQKVWEEAHGQPTFSNVRWAGAARRK